MQKRAIQMARENAKPVIVATQMLDSMIELTADPGRGLRRRERGPRRRRRGDAVRGDLGGEVSAGGRSDHVPHHLRGRGQFHGRAAADACAPHQTRVISYAARDIGERLDAKALVAFTQSGDTVKRLARLHTPLPLLAFTAWPEVRSQLAMTWGTETFIVPMMTSTDGMIRQVDKSLLELGRYRRGDLVVIVAGAPPGTVGSTNLIHVHRIGEDDV